MRVGYELDPGLKPFVELEGDQRIHDQQFDRSDLQRDSVARAAKSEPPSICSARSPARWPSAMSSAPTRIRRCRMSAA